MILPNEIMEHTQGLKALMPMTACSYSIYVHVLTSYIISVLEINNNNFWLMYIERILNSMHTIVPNGKYSTSSLSRIKKFTLTYSLHYPRIILITTMRITAEIIHIRGRGLFFFFLEG